MLASPHNILSSSLWQPSRDYWSTPYRSDFGVSAQSNADTHVEAYVDSPYIPVLKAQGFTALSDNVEIGAIAQIS
ncbi:MAG TPA: hypothetical protein V6D35_03335 [Candidatus Sericytochromatia bacterium]|jgi:hypothetical protein